VIVVGGALVPLLWWLLNGRTGQWVFVIVVVDGKESKKMK
jgi:hypothetical protein